MRRPLNHPSPPALPSPFQHIARVLLHKHLTRVAQVPILCINNIYSSRLGTKLGTAFYYPPAFGLCSGPPGHGDLFLSRFFRILRRGQKKEGTAPLLLRVSGDNPEPLYQQIINEIRRLILTGELSPGDPLPSVRELAQKLTT
ncbi:MAG: GntR family transcriptional regulator, partial [Clostridia bacterium]|nr:GntR family transcriptional regulator [Clostridia bacterium]